MSDRLHYKVGNHHDPLEYASGSFDGCYSVQAVWPFFKKDELDDHAREMYRVLKPGARYACSEYLLTPHFDWNNPEHVALHKSYLPTLAATQSMYPADVCAALEKASLAASLMVDCSHANASKIARNQEKVWADILKQRAKGDSPVTGAMITAKLESTSPHYNISYQAVMPNGNIFKGSETITGTTVGLRGLGMPAPSKFTFTSGEYSVELEGLITSELALSLVGNTRIRAYGFLNIKDNQGNTGRLELNRAGDISIKINDTITSNHSIAKITWIDIQTPAPQPV